MFKTKNNTLGQSALTAILDMLPIGDTARKLIGKLLKPENLKRIAIAAVVGSALVALIGKWIRNSMLRMEIRGEVKKQLEPVYEKLEELDEQNQELLRQNVELHSSLEELSSI